MADTKVSNLDAQTVWIAADVMYVVAGGTASKKMTLEDLFTEIVVSPVVKNSNGIDIDTTDGGDADVDLITCLVTGTPKLWWDESEDLFAATKPVSVTSKLKIGTTQAIYLPDQTDFVGSFSVGNGGTALVRVGTNPVDPLSFEQDGSYNGTRNTFVGVNAGLLCDTGNGNTFVGYEAGKANTNGDQNTFIGWWAGVSNTSGYHNTFIGVGAGQPCTTGYFNTAVGCDAALTLTEGLYNTLIGTSCGKVTTGDYNTVVGAAAGAAIGTGSYNTFLGEESGKVFTASAATGVGFGALYASQSGINTAVGAYALQAVVTGSGNTVMGYEAGKAITGSDNCGFGHYVLNATVGGANNVAMGYQAGYYNTSGSGNVCIGFRSGTYHADGSTHLTTASSSVYVGKEARGKNDSDSNTIVVGYQAIGLGANTVAIGNANITLTVLQGNLGVGGQATFGTNSAKVVAIPAGTAPSSSPADAAQLYVADQAAGNACLHTRTEGGAVLKLYQETTAVAEAAFTENAGGAAVNVDSTFGGYTLQQIVKALQLQGLLA